MDRAVLIFLISLCFMGCKKDTRDPELQLDLPASAISMMAGDTVVIAGTASDDQELGLLSFTLSADDGSSIEGTAFHSLEGQEQIFYEEFILGGIHTPIGNYDLKVRVEDGSGNFTSQLIPAFLTEIPKTLIQTYFISENGSGSGFLSSPDSNGTLTTHQTIGAGISSAGADHFNQQLVMTDKGASRFNIIDPDFPGNLSNSFLASNGGLSESFTDLAISNHKYYTSLGISPFVMVFSISGNLIASLSNVTVPATAIAADENIVFVGEYGSSPGFRRLRAYNFNTQDPIRSVQTDWRIDHIHLLGNGEILITGNSGTIGKVWLLDEATFFIKDQHDLSEKVISSSNIGETIYILTETELIRYSNSSMSFSAPLQTGSFTCLGIESLSLRPWIGGNGLVHELDPNGTILNTWNESGLDFTYLFFLYNK